MGNVLGCIEGENELQRLEYDMSPLFVNPVPIIWMVGAERSGKTIQSKILNEKLDFKIIDLRELINEEGRNETDRGQLIKDCNTTYKKIPDFVIVDLVKEAMLDAAKEFKRGFVIIDFPRSSKQASLFVTEIGQVDLIIFLNVTTNVLISRYAETSKPSVVVPEKIQQEIHLNHKEIKESLRKFVRKIEKIRGDGRIEEVATNIQHAILERLTIKTDSSSSEQNMPDDSS